MRKPSMYGCPAIRVYHEGKDEWFYDVLEAVQYVKDNWTHGKELSARVRNDRYYERIYTIMENGEAYVSPLYSELVLSAPVKVELA